MTPDDRVRAREGDFAFDDLLVHLLDIDEQTYDRYYNGFANRILWFAAHGLWTDAPIFGDDEYAMWDAFRSVNATVATAMAEEAAGDALLLPQDYHLALVPLALRNRDAGPVAAFWHIPFPTPENLALLPRAWAVDLLEGMLGADVLGFHVRRWVMRFTACCEQFLGARVVGPFVEHRGHRTGVVANAIGIDAAALRRDAGAVRVDDLLRERDEAVGDRVLLLRVDRTEPSKNTVGGLLAYETLLEQRPDLVDRVTQLVSLTPSREQIPEYQAYMRECETIIERIAGRFGPAVITLEVEDDFQKTLAAFRHYDVLVVNSVSDGLNLVALEGPTVNQRDGVLVLSRETGAADQIGDAALLIDPFDQAQTVAALEQAIEMSAPDRATRAALLRERAEGKPPPQWLAEQITTLEEATRP